MSEDRFLSYWRAGMAIGMTIVGVVAVLLLAIIATARRILANANRALAVAEEIKQTTRPIWDLEQTSRAASHLEAESRTLEMHLSSVADSVEAAGNEG